MELRQLRYVIAVAEELHFGRAAAREHITPSALSQQIARLERELGVTLFERTPRRVTPTAAGAAFAAEARTVLRGTRQATAAARAAAAELRGRLLVGFTSHGAGPLMTRWVRMFTAAHPQVAVELRELDFVAHFRALDDRLVDLQFVRLPFEVGPGTQVELLLTEPRLVAVPPGHPLAAGDPAAPLTLADLAAETCFRLPPGVSPAWADHFAPWGSPPDAPVVTTVGETLALVAMGAGVALVPRSLARLLPRVDVVYRQAEIDPSRLAVAWRAGAAADALAGLVVELAAAHELGTVPADV